MPPQPWPIVTDDLYGDVPNGLFPAQDSSYQLTLLPFGGLKEHCVFPLGTEVREGWAWGDYMYWLVRRGSNTVLYRVDESGNFAELGFFSTTYTGPAWIRNNPTQLGIVDGVWCYVFTPAKGLLEPVSDLNFTGAACLEYQDGYGLMSRPNSNQWFFTNPDNFLNMDAIDFYSKQARTDNIRTIRSFQREPYIFGTEKGTEVWYNAGGDNTTIQSPTFARNSGGLIEYGLASPKGEGTMAGTGLHFLSNQGQIIKAQGYQAQVVSNQMFHREVIGDGTPEHPGYSTIEDCICFSFRDQGHNFQQFTFPTAGTTWVLDGTTNMLVKRQSWKSGGGYGRHRANCYVLFKNKHFVGDYENGKVYEMNAAYHDDDGHVIQRLLYSKDMNGGRSRISFPNIQVLIEAGHGLEDNSAPQVGLEFSANGGKSWSNMVTRSVGLTGNYDWQVNFDQLGSDYRRMYRLTMTDPVLWRIIGLDMGGGQ